MSIFLSPNSRGEVSIVEPNIKDTLPAISVSVSEDGESLIEFPNNGRWVVANWKLLNILKSKLNFLWQYYFMKSAMHLPFSFFCRLLIRVYSYLKQTFIWNGHFFVYTYNAFKFTYWILSPTIHNKNIIRSQRR